MLIESKSASAVADHLFRHEAGRMIARLTRTFGPHRFDLAEEAVQDALCTALETWKFYGIPDDPGAWLMRVARNRAIDLIRRGRRFEGILDALAVEPSSACVADVEGDWPHDDRLLLIFSCCDPLVSVDAQLALILKALCGFSLGEIGAALFASPSAIEKRVTRTKGFLKRSKSLFDFTDAGQVRTRLDSVHQALYLIFSEGYHSVRADAPVRDELCREAIRLALLIAEDRTIGTPATDALLAMMYLDLARLAGRVDEEGVFLPLSRQDRSRWDQRLIAVASDTSERQPKEGSSAASTSRRRSRPSTAGHPASSRPIGGGYSNSTKCLRSCRPRQWSRSIARSSGARLMERWLVLPPWIG